MWGYIVTKFGTTYAKLAENDISSNLENFLTHPDIWGASTLPQVQVLKKLARNDIKEGKSSNAKQVF